MSTNGHGALVVLVERVRDLEYAQRALAQRIDEQYRARILALERDVDRIARELAGLLNK